MRLAPCLLAALACAPLLAAPQSRPGERVPPPSSETVELEARKLLQRAGVADVASLSKSAHAKLAARLVEDARAAGAGSDAQFAALSLAWRSAVEGADIELTLRALESLDAAFEVQAGALHVEAFKGLARSASGGKIKLVVARALEFVRRSIDLEDYESALELLDDVKLRKFARDDAESLPLYESLWTAEVQAFKTMREWLAKLAHSPDDPQANHYAGYYYCFERRDFARGVAHLSRSHLEPFKAIAALDNTAPSDAAGRIALALNWAGFAGEHLSKARAKTAARARARHWLAAARTSAPTAEQLAELERLSAVLDADDAAQDEQRARAKPAAGPALAKRAAAPKLPRESQPLVDAALAWLVAHQAADGHWSSGSFPLACESAGVGRDEGCKQVGEADHDVGVSALALSALMAAGSDASAGPHAEAVQRGLFWLIGQQSAESGLIGRRVGAGFIYSHALATVTLAQAQRASPTEELANVLQRAVQLILTARNANSGWRYELEPTGASDSSVTVWMVKALVAADRAGVPLDPAAAKGALAFIDAMTSLQTARIGYADPGSISARVARVNDQFNAARGEALTAAGLTVRLLLGQSKASNTLVERHAELIASKPPTWATDPGAAAGVDFYGWYHGALALRGVGEPYAGPWFDALRTALSAGQRRDGHAKGSWDASGDPWGYSGGRVYATALGALALLAEVGEALAPPASGKKK